MTISVLTTVMSSDGKSESSHELNFFLDKQLQSRLLEQDEILVASELLAQITGGADGKFSGTKTNFNSKNDALVGWVTDSKVPLRRPEKESAKNVNQNNSTSWRDNRYKQQTVQIQDNYVFKHYADTHGYIEQYRRDHTNVYGLKAAGFQALQGARQYMTQSVTPSQIHAQQQNNMCNCCNNAVSNLNSYITAALHYTNRAGYSLLSPGNYSGSNSANSCSHSTSNNQNHSHSSHSCSKHKNHVDLASQAYKYKLSPETMWNIRSESQNSLESDRTLDMKTPRINSAKGRQAGKTPTKVTVPVSAQMQAKQPPQQVPIAWRLPRQGTQTKPNESTTTPSSNGIRTLDTLACVATDKQKKEDVIPNTESLTWCEKLELLRAVNKPKERPKIKPPKLKFYKDSDSPPAPIVREATRAQLYEQRRIKHLLQQVRMKGSNNFDWLTKDDDNLNTKSTEDSDDSDSTSSSDEEVADQHPRNIRKGIDISHAEGAILSRYNMKSVVKRQGFKGVPFFTRTNTEVYQD